MRAPIARYRGPHGTTAALEVYRIETPRSGPTFVVRFRDREIGRLRSYPDRAQCLDMLYRAGKPLPGERPQNLARPSQRPGALPGIDR